MPASALCHTFPHDLQPESWPFDGVKALAAPYVSRLSPAIDLLLNTDRWYYRVFQSAPDLIRALLPGSGAAAANALGLDPEEPGDRLYRFEALELKELSHRLDGVPLAPPNHWPQRNGQPRLPSGAP